MSSPRKKTDTSKTDTGGSGTNDPAAEPWLASVTVVLDTAVVSKSNHRQRSRATANDGSWRRFKQFEADLALRARAELPSNWPDLGPELPLQERPVVAVVIIASTMLDAANLPKSITDALEGVCYENDASARSVSSVTIRSRTPHAVIVAAAFPADVPLETLTAAQQPLMVHAHRAFTELLDLSDTPR